MMPTLKTVSILAPVLAPLAGRILDRMIFEQPAQQSPQIIQVPAPSKCKCCCQLQQGGSIEEETTTAEFCSTCAEQSTTFKENSKHLLDVPTTSSTRIRSVSTSEDSSEKPKKKTARVSRSFSDSETSTEKKAKIDDETLAILAHYLSKEVIDDTGNKTWTFPKVPTRAKDVNAPAKSADRRSIAVCSKSPKSSLSTKKTTKPSRFPKSSTENFKSLRDSRPPIEDLQGLSCRHVSSKF